MYIHTYICNGTQSIKLCNMKTNLYVLMVRNWDSEEINIFMYVHIFRLSFPVFSKETMKFILFLNFSFLFGAFLILDKCSIVRTPRFKNSLTINQCTLRIFYKCRTKQKKCQIWIKCIINMYRLYWQFVTMVSSYVTLRYLKLFQVSMRTY